MEEIQCNISILMQITQRKNVGTVSTQEDGTVSHNSINEEFSWYKVHKWPKMLLHIQHRMLVHFQTGQIGKKWDGTVSTRDGGTLS